MPTSWKIAAAACLVLLTQACEDEETETNDTAKPVKTSSGLDGSIKLADLSRKQVQKLCEYVVDLDNKSFSSETDYCLRDTTAEFCTEELPECLGSGSYEAYINEDPGCDELSVDDLFEGECTATVGEYQACIRDLINQETEAYKNASCSNLAAAEAKLDVAPASCFTLVGKCRDIDL